MERAPTPIRIDEIKQDRSVWPRETYDEEALDRYRESADTLPPIRVDRATRILLDGFHRVRVFSESGKEEIPAVLEECPTERLLARALELNLHGTPIPIEQRNKIIQKLSDQGLMQEAIARAAGISQKRVSQILATSKRDGSDKRIPEALRLIEAGHSLREAERMTGVPKSTLERALLDAKRRQEFIRGHLQFRGGLTSLLRYPDRGPWGKARYPGNCTGYLIVNLIDYFKPQSVFDPMEGSGTTKEVCFDLKVAYEGRDLKSGFDILSSSLPEKKFDLIFWHPPYWPGFQYSRHPNDFSNADGFEDFKERVKCGFARLRKILHPEGHIVTMIGDGRKNGIFYPIHSEIISWNLLPLEAVLIKEGDHERQARHFKYGPTAFIPTLHEYVLIFKGCKHDR